LGKFLEGLEKKKVGILFGHMKFIMDIWYISLLFGNLVAIGYIFPHFGTLRQDKSGNPVHLILCRRASHATDRVRALPPDQEVGEKHSASKQASLTLVTYCHYLIPTHN
jgi:hypothetical protein